MIRDRSHTLLAALAAVGLLGCPTGKTVGPSRDLHLLPWPDLVSPLEPARPGDRTAVEAGRRDTRLPADTRPPDTRAPDTTRPQGTTCSGNGVTFTASAPPKACGTVDLTVQAGSAWAWILGGVKDSKGTVAWAKPSVVTANPCCTWVFNGLAVPCGGAGPPFSFNLMKDATNDNPAVGNIAGSCVP